MSDTNETTAAHAGPWGRVKAILAKIGTSMARVWTFVWLKSHDQEQPK